MSLVRPNLTDLAEDVLDLMFDGKLLLQEPLCIILNGMELDYWHIRKVMELHTPITYALDIYSKLTEEIIIESSLNTIIEITSKLTTSLNFKSPLYYKWENI